MRPLSVIACIAALVIVLPLSVWGRSPLTDSTDVAIPTLRSEVQNSVFASPLNPQVLLVGNVDRTNMPAQTIATWISEDGGRTWSSGPITDSFGDPAVAIGRIGGSNGRFLVSYTRSASARDIIVANKNTPPIPWGPVTVQLANGLDLEKVHLWIDNDASSQYPNFLWAAWKDPFSANLELKFSYDHGAIWRGVGGSQTGNPIPIDDPDKPADKPEGVNLHTGPYQGITSVYGTWTLQNGPTDPPHGIAFRRSDNGGLGWMSPGQGNKQKKFTIGGYLNLQPGKTMRTPTFPSMAVDQGSGHIFIVWSERDKVGPGNAASIYMAESADGGATWGTVQRIDRAPNSDQFDQWFPRIAWDECTGGLAVLYYDSRDTGNSGANTYMGVSFATCPGCPTIDSDGPCSGPVGKCWTDFKVSDTAWDGDVADNFAGDYIGLAAADGFAYPVWSDDRAQSDYFKPYVSPIYLWGIDQASVTAAHVGEPVMSLTVTVSWNTNLPAADGDQLLLKAPSGAEYSTTCSNCTANGLAHTMVRTVPCEPGWWDYWVYSAKTGCTTRRVSNKGKFLANCIE